jgi:hypothetical protein
MAKRHGTILTALVVVLALLAGCVQAEPAPTATPYDDGLGLPGGVGSRAVDPNILCYREQGGDKFVCASGGEIELQAGATLDVDGDVDLDPTGFDIDTTGAIDLDADLASGLATAAGDITIEAETGSVIVRGNEAVADAIYLDANDNASTGITMITGATSGYALTGGPFDVNVTGGISLDADLASNLNAAAGDIGLEAETGSVIIKGDEAVADAIYLDANDNASTGITMITGATSGYALTGGPFDVNVTGGISLDADLASNLNAAAGDIGLEAETGSVIVKGDEAVADAIYLDADDAAGTGITIAVGATGGLTIGGGLTDIGVGTYATADGDNDLGVAGDLEVDGATDLDGALAISGAVTGGSTATFAGDVTVSAEATGGNALAINQFIGVPRITMVGIGTMANGTTNTVLTDIGDSETPATDWTAIDGDTVMSNDATRYRQGTASLKMAVASTADATDGTTNALASGNQDWTDDEAVGMWIYTTKALDAGDLVFIITDSVAGDTSTNIPAVAVNTWTWVEVNISGVATASKDVITDLSIELSAAGEAKAAAGAFDVYFDFIVKWDVDEEEALGQSILQDGVMSLLMIDATSGAATSATLTLYTDYFVHYQSGTDAIVIISNQSDADKVGVALIAY